ncbi:MAG TPA: SPFH domain-containing protein [Thermoanaerobaculia bacterium]|jgi:regulator of protease activity HflC (stomatin/prohibitin superfamily)|nr:SPFH domain-containing protein [Thermoanaerobaculia bacterium]
MNALPSVVLPGIGGGQRGAGPTFFWTAALAWTVLAFVLDRAADASGAAVPRVGLLGYLLGLAILYLLGGINVVREWERRPIMLLGRYVRTIGPGLEWVDPIFHRGLDDVSVRDVVNELRIGGVQTHDNVPISFNLIMTTRVGEDRVKDFVVQVASGYEATRQRALASVTEIVGNHELDAILHDRGKFYAEVRDSLQTKVAGWGVIVKAVELKDLQITDEQIQQAIAMKARAGKEADAELVRAAMQLHIAGKLVEAAAALTPDAWRLKELEVLVELTRSAQNNTILIPTTLLKGLEDIGAAAGRSAPARGATSLA